jgi:hypothetical protein
MSNIDQLCTLAQGNLFFIQQLCDLFEQRDLPSNIDLPRTLNEIFHYRFLNNQIQEQMTICRAILEICLASRRPINLNVLYNCLNIDEELQVEWSIFIQVKLIFEFLSIFFFFLRVSLIYLYFSHNSQIPHMQSFMDQFGIG